MTNPFFAHSPLRAVIAQALWFVIFGLLLMYTPRYLHLTGTWKVVCFVLGTIPLSMAFTLVVMCNNFRDIRA